MRGPKRVPVVVVEEIIVAGVPIHKGTEITLTPAQVRKLGSKVNEVRP